MVSASSTAAFCLTDVSVISLFYVAKLLKICFMCQTYNYMFYLFFPRFVYMDICVFKTDMHAKTRFAKKFLGGISFPSKCKTDNDMTPDFLLIN